MSPSIIGMKGRPTGRPVIKKLNSKLYDAVGLNATTEEKQIDFGLVKQGVKP